MIFTGLISVLLFSGTAPSAFAGAWTQPKGKGQVIATLSYSEADAEFGDGGGTVEIPDFRKVETRLYVEYGLTDWATLVAQPEWRWKSIGDGPGEEVYGLGRVDVGLRTRLWQDDVAVVSVQGSVRAPGSNRELAPANGGDTEWEIDGRLLYGRGFDVFGRHGFVDVQAGYRHRFGDPADELRLDLTAGIDATPEILAVAQSFNTLSVGTPRGGFRETREHKLSASLVYRPGPWGVQAGVLATVAGENALKERGGFVALWRSF